MTVEPTTAHYLHYRWTRLWSPTLSCDYWLSSNTYCNSYDVRFENGAPHVGLRCAGLEEAQLEEMAFQLFVTTCTPRTQGGPLLHTVRTRLQVRTSLGPRLLLGFVPCENSIGAY